MPTIQRITPRPFRLPLRGALRWGASSELAALEHVLLEVELSDGSLGRAEIPPRPTIYGETLASVLAALDYLRPRLLGVDAEDADRIQGILEGLPYNHTAKGGIDTALWEAWAASQGQALWQMLTPAHTRVKVSYILGIADQAEMLADAETVYRQGVRVFKVKVGRHLAQDLIRLEQLRNHFPTVELYADANQTLSPETAVPFMEAWARAGLLFVEEPLPVEEVVERKKLCSQRILPIIADDSAFTARDYFRETQLKTFDILNLKPARTGITQTLQMLAMNRQLGLSAMVGSQAQSSFGAYQSALLAFQEGVDQPSELAFHLKAEGSFANFPELHNGWLHWDELIQTRFDEGLFAGYVLN